MVPALLWLTSQGLGFLRTRGRSCPVLAITGRVRTPLFLSALLLAGSGCTCGSGSTLHVGGSARPVDAGAQDAWIPATRVVDAGPRTVLEICGNHLDDDGDGLVDEDCTCTVGDTRPCSSGAPGQRGVGACRAGLQTCETSDEFGAWGACVGEVLPAAETCNGVDDDCDGVVDQNLVQVCSTACGSGTSVCSAGTWGTCSARRPGVEVCNGLDDDCDGQIDESLSRACSSACGAGTEACAAGAWGTCSARTPGVEVCNNLDDDCDGLVDEGLTRGCASMCGTGTEACSAGNWGSCSARTPTAEICGNGIDENCDGVDDRCVCIHTASQTAWQIHQGEPPMCWPQTFPTNGNTGEYQYSTIPAANDPGWAAHASPNISFDTRSTMCGVNGGPDLCACRAGGDFTYFQTSFDIPSGFTVSSMVVSIANVDDGVRVTVYNASHPSGVVGGYAFLGGGATADLAQYIVSGTNRIVLTHIDDCCQVRRIANASITMNGTALNACP